MDSPSSDGVITGRLIFLTMTELPDSDAATSFVLNALFSNSRRIASATAAPSMIAPSTMLSGGTGSLARATTRKPFPAGLSSTALTALDPISRPTTAFVFLVRPNTSQSCLSLKSLRKASGRSAKAIPHPVPLKLLKIGSASPELQCQRDVELAVPLQFRQAITNLEGCSRRGSPISAGAPYRIDCVPA